MASSKPWVSVGWAAWPEGLFLQAQQECCSQIEPLRVKIYDFMSSPMGAIVENRKKAVRLLGGTLSDTDQARRQALKRLSPKEMEEALLSPNFVLFELKTIANIPEAISLGALKIRDDNCYRLQSAVSPFMPCSLWMDENLWKMESMQCVIHPKLKEEWTADQGNKEGPSGHNGFKYYIAINDLGNPNCLSESDPAPLVHMLKRNQPFQGTVFEQDGIYPLCSSMESAMTLGFYAYKLTNLKLVEVQYRGGLIGGKAPLSHPMGNFWFLPGERIGDWLKHGSLRLFYAPFEMCWVQSDKVKTPADLYKEAMQVNLKKRKAALISEVAGLKEVVALKQQELSEVEKALSLESTPSTTACSGAAAS